MLGPHAAGVSRYPRVVPGWRRRIACTRNVPTANSPGSTCCTVSFADNASSGTGNTAGSICWRRIASSDVVPWREPQMRTALPGAKKGLKWGRPWIWSQWACDSRISACTALCCRSTSSRPTARIPLPAPRMTGGARRLARRTAIRGRGGGGEAAGYLAWPRLVGEVGQQRRHPAVHGQQDQAAGLLIHAPPAAGARPQERHGDARRLLQESLEGL